MQSVAFISGATGFAGSLISKHLADQGINLVLSSKDYTRLKKLADTLTQQYPNVGIKVIECDLTVPESWHLASNYLNSLKIDAYINCSGIQGSLGPNQSIDDVEFKRVFNVNLFSSIYFTNFFASRVIGNERLSIIHFSGGGAASPRPYFMPYSLSKTALTRFVENFALENLGKNIQINTVAPGVLPSKMQVEILNSLGTIESDDYLVAQKSIASEGYDETNLLKLCDFLLSEKSMHISGKLISANWDNWAMWPDHLDELINSDLYTLRRITARDRGRDWGDL